MRLARSRTLTRDAKKPRPDGGFVATFGAMLRFLLLLLIPSVSVQAMELLRDRHAGEEYVFESDQSEMVATVDADGATRWG
jgi:hypothetical protein